MRAALDNPAAIDGHGERLAMEGEICWGGMHSWKYALQVLEGVGQPKRLGFQADMAHTLLYILGYVADDALMVTAAVVSPPTTPRVR